MDWAPTKTADSWMFSHSEGIDLLITGINVSSRGMYAWVEMRWRGSAPRPGLITAARYDLQGARTVGSMVARIKDAGIDDKEPDWRRLIQTAVYDVITDYLDGPEPVTLANVEPREAGFVLRPLIGAVGATSLTGAGQMGKSILALACSASVATGNEKWMGMKVMRPGPVIYVDWEADAETHASRLAALAEGVGEEMPEGIHYIAAEAPLPVWSSALARRCASIDAALIVIDSVMLARGGEAAAAETIAFYLSLRQLGRPVLLIDHQSREAIEKGKTGAYGSVINDNSARLRWVLRGDQVSMTLKPVKANNFGKLPSIHLSLDTQGPPEAMTAARWVHIDAPPPRGSLTDRILETIREHPVIDAVGIGKLLGEEPNKIRPICARLKERGAVEQIDNGYLALDDPY